MQGVLTHHFHIVLQQPIFHTVHWRIFPSQIVVVHCLFHPRNNKINIIIIHFIHIDNHRFVLYTIYMHGGSPSLSLALSLSLSLLTLDNATGSLCSKSKYFSMLINVLKNIDVSCEFFKSLSVITPVYNKEE